MREGRQGKLLSVASNHSSNEWVATLCYVTDLIKCCCCCAFAVGGESSNSKKAVTSYYVYSHLLGESAHKKCMALFGLLDFNQLIS